MAFNGVCGRRKEGRLLFVKFQTFIRYAVVHLSPHLFPHFERRKNTAIFPPGNVSRKNSRTTYINARAIKIFGVSALIRAGKQWLCQEQKMLQILVRSMAKVSDISPGIASAHISHLHRDFPAGVIYNFHTIFFS